MENIAPIAFFVHLELGGYERPKHEVQVSGELLEYWVTEPCAMQPPPRQRVRPSARQWTTFWAEMEKIGVWKWLPEYDSGALDGIQWELELRCGDRRLKSMGSNSYPGHPEPGFTQKCAFGQFVKALERLIGPGTRIR